MANEKIFQMTFSKIYPMYIQKAERKDHTKEEVNQVIQWLTGYSNDQLEEQINNKSTMQQFFENAPKINPNAEKITGVICGVKVQEIEDPLMQKIRYMDKLVDEVAKGKKMEKILRQ
ncbi:DUF2200 domain-containing protein [Companilactobacillus zhongbaensis]|uniref:DUF2200 domain-containing protein n=1 Tax=Companilactobacillus zhongbaensis TaxID=2486009 RepID=UPI000F7B71DA|nr:DUF2200 domain-containing protein [Companilactobacillus zhongbaensis]